MSSTNAAGERWRPVAGAEGRYEVSDQGRVRSCHRIVTRSDGRIQRWPGRILRPTPATDGRLRVSIGGATRPVHLLVLAAFVGPRPPGSVASWCDDDHTNNQASNLRWIPRATWEADKRGGRGRRRRAVCSRGHRREPPNLVLGACAACARAHTTVFNAANRQLLAEIGKEALLQREADRHYQAIMHPDTPEDQNQQSPQHSTARLKDHLATSSDSPTQPSQDHTLHTTHLPNYPCTPMHHDSMVILRALAGAHRPTGQDHVER